MKRSLVQEAMDSDKIILSCKEAENTHPSYRRIRKWKNPIILTGYVIEVLGRRIETGLKEEHLYLKWQGENLLVEEKDKPVDILEEVYKLILFSRQSIAEDSGAGFGLY